MGKAHFLIAFHRRGMCFTHSPKKTFYRLDAFSNKAWQPQSIQTNMKVTKAASASGFTCFEQGCRGEETQTPNKSSCRQLWQKLGEKNTLSRRHWRSESLSFYKCVEGKNKNFTQAKPLHHWAVLLQFPLLSQKRTLRGNEWKAAALLRRQYVNHWNPANSFLLSLESAFWCDERKSERASGHFDAS